jgi:hypothetical protein
MKSVKDFPCETLNNGFVEMLRVISRAWYRMYVEEVNVLDMWMTNSVQSISLQKTVRPGPYINHSIDADVTEDCLLF